MAIPLALCVMLEVFTIDEIPNEKKSIQIIYVHRDDLQSDKQIYLYISGHFLFEMICDSYSSWRCEINVNCSTCISALIVWVNKAHTHTHTGVCVN